MLGIADDAPFSAAIGDSDHGAFPAHPHSQRLHLIQRHLGAVANAALSRTAIHVMLNTITCKRPDSTIVEPYGEMNGKLAFRLSQNLAHILREVKLISGSFELLDRHIVGIQCGRL